MRAYPVSYRLAFGDDLAASLEAAYPNDQHAHLSECRSLVSSGLKRRLRHAASDSFATAYACLLTLESLFALFLIGFGTDRAAVYWSSYGSRNLPTAFYDGLTFRVVGFQHHWLPLVAYFALSGALALGLGAAATRTWRRLGIGVVTRGFGGKPDEGPAIDLAQLSAWSSLDVACLLSQPFILLAAGAAVAVASDDVPYGSTLRGNTAFGVMIAGLAIGLAVVVMMRRSLACAEARTGVASAVRTVAGVVMAAALFLVAGGGFDSSEAHLAWAPAITNFGLGANLLTGFTSLDDAATGATVPQAVACDATQCSVYSATFLADTLDLPYHSAFLTSDDGDGWQLTPFQQPDPPLLPEFGGAGLACAPPRTCLGMLEPARSSGGGVFFLRTSDAGRTWQVDSLPLRSGLSYAFQPVVACTQVTTCILETNAGLAVTADGGRSWRKVIPFDTLPVPPHHGTSPTVTDDPAGLACDSTGTCRTVVLVTAVAGGFEASQDWMLSTTDGGAKWTKHQVTVLDRSLCSACSASAGVLGSFTCAGARYCILSSPDDHRLWITSDGGATFKSVTVPVGVTHADLTCLSTEICFAVQEDGIPVLWRTSDGGIAWNVSPMPAGVAPGVLLSGATGAGNTSAIACENAQYCVLLAHDIAGNEVQPNVLAVTSNGGLSWRAEPVPLLPTADRPEVPAGLG